MSSTKLLIYMLLCSIAFFACAWAVLTPDQQAIVIKISARRLAAHGAQSCPVIFAELGKTARNACDRPGETLTPAAALEMIAEAVGRQLKDPLLAADLKDLAELLGIRFDPALKLIGLTPEQERLVKIAVCSFAEGVQLYP